MNEELIPGSRENLRQYLLALADDELLLAHRNSEWTGHAPILEEDIAFSNIAQDELGHATIWFGLLEELTGKVPDVMVFLRDAADFRNVQMVELPKGDWAFSMVRQYLFDAYELVRCERDLESVYRPLSEATAKIRQEERYHYRHTSSWIRRLGLGTVESKRRAQEALDELWPYALQLFNPIERDRNEQPEESKLLQERLAPSELQAAWTDLVVPHLTHSGLVVPAGAVPAAATRNEHTGHLAALLGDLQLVARLDPEAEW